MSVGKLPTYPAYDLALVSELFLWEVQEDLRSCGLQALRTMYGNRTRDLSVKGTRLNPLTNTAVLLICLSPYL